MCFQTHKTGDPVGDAALKKQLGLEPTADEQDALLTAVGDELFSTSAMSRERAELALNDFDNSRINPAIRDAANAEIVAINETLVKQALDNPTLENVGAAGRFEALLGGRARPVPVSSTD
jgi:hypothetical protein